MPPPSLGRRNWVRVSRRGRYAAIRSLISESEQFSGGRALKPNNWENNVGKYNPPKREKTPPVEKEFSQLFHPKQLPTAERISFRLIGLSEKTSVITLVRTQKSTEDFTI